MPYDVSSCRIEFNRIYTRLYYSGLYSDLALAFSSSCTVREASTVPPSEVRKYGTEIGHRAARFIHEEQIMDEMRDREARVAKLQIRDPTFGLNGKMRIYVRSWRGLKSWETG